jgi:hypothetical protein
MSRGGQVSYGRRINEPTLNSPRIREHQDRKSALKHWIRDRLTLPCEQVSGTARLRASGLSMRARPIDQTEQEHADPHISHLRHLSQLLDSICPHTEAPRARRRTACSPYQLGGSLYVSSLRPTFQPGYVAVWNRSSMPGAIRSHFVRTAATNAFELRVQRL